MRKKVLRGIGLVSALSVGEDGYSNLLDYRIYAKKQDGKTKLQLAWEMIERSRAQIVLFDSWYASRDLISCLQEIGKRFYSTLPGNRIFYDEKGKKHRVEDYQFTEQELKEGKLIQLNKLNFMVRIFCIFVRKGGTEIIITNDIAQNSLEEILNMMSLRWKVEEFHREIKQLTGIEQCQARKSRIQRNHICCCLMAWQFLKTEAWKRQVTVYLLHESQSDDFIRSQLLKPNLKFA